MAVTFIPKQPAPTEQGWYYGRGVGAPIQEIIPWLVLGDPGELFVTSPLQPRTGHPINAFDWFGPVPNVEEASTS